MNKTQIKSWVVLLSVAGIAGCQSHPSTEPHEQIVHGEVFHQEADKRDVNNFTDAQTATAARADSTLYPCHFSGGELNSLGREKIGMMLKDGDAVLPMTVYLDMAKDTPSLSDRQDAVTAYLQDAGMTSAQFKLQVGPNMTYGYPAAVGMRALAASDQGGSSGAPAPAAAGGYSK